MNAWPSPPVPRSAMLPPGLRLAGMGVRIAAWLIDSVVLGSFQLGFWMVAGAIGVIGINREAEAQIEASPLSLPDVAPYHANLPALGLLLAVFVVLNVLYAALFWARWRGLPGQRILSLQIGEAATGRNLSLRRALVRSIVAVGIPVAALAVAFFAFLVVETTVPWSEVVHPDTGGEDAWLLAWSAVMELAMLVAVAWPVVLLIWTVISSTRQGLHDRLAGSLVVGNGWAQQAYPSYGPTSPPISPPSYPPPVGDDAAGGPPEASPGQSEPGAPTGPGPSPGGWAPPGGYPSDQLSGSGQGPLWLRSEDESDAAPRLHAATVGRRVVAYFFDCIVVYLLFSAIATFVLAAFPQANAATIDERTYILLGLVGGCMQLAYFTSGWAVWQGTLGQRLLHLQVGDARTGKPLSWMDALVRWAVLQGPFALVTIMPEVIRPIVLMAAATWSLYLLYTTLYNPDVRGLHDRFINSRVAQEL